MTGRTYNIGTGRQWHSIQDEVELDESTLSRGYVTWTHTFFPDRGCALAFDAHAHGPLVRGGGIGRP